MNKKLIRCFLSLFASALMAHAAYAENSATFTLWTPCYYVDNRVNWENPDFVSGTRGAFMSFESFPATATYYCESDSGYHVSKWVLRTAGISGNKTIQTWENTSSIGITFDYKWAAKYGTSLELIVYVDQLNYTLSYDANGGNWTAGQPDGGEYKFSDSVTAPGAEVVEREDYDFKGWKSSRGSLIAAGASFDGSDLGITSDGQSVVLYAQWEAKTYTYDVMLAVPEGASVTGLTKDSSDEDWDYYKTTYVAGKGLTLPKATKAGSTFVAWYDNPNFVEDADAKLYSKVTKIGKDETGDKEYWAKFETKLAIHYDGNGSSKGTMEDQEFTAGESISLDRNKFEKVYTVKFKLNGASGTAPANQTADYTFAHWNTAKDGTGDSHEDGQTVTFDEPVTLYAQWEEEKDAITLPEAPTWSGHTFSGWWTQQSGGTCVGYADDKYAPTGNITLYAHWDGQGDLSAAVGLTNATLTTWCTKKSTYKGEDNLWEEYANGSKGPADTCLGLPANELAGATSVLSMNVTGPGIVTFKATTGSARQEIIFFNGLRDESLGVAGGDWPTTNITRSVTVSGAVQVKWSVASANKTVWLDDITWTPTGSAGEYTITAQPSDNAGGSVTGGGTYDKDDKVTLKAKPNTGWKFLGWRKNSETAIVSTKNPYEFKATESATYTAVLADEWYYIAYNKNGGTGSMTKQLAVRDTEWQLTANAFTSTGYTFAGWNTAKDGSGTAYADGATVNNLTTSGKTVTLYAQWKSGSEEEEKEKEEEQEEEEEEVLPEPGPYASAVGEAVSVDLAADCEGWTIKSVSGLPTGLKYNKSTGLVTGTPTKAVSKEDDVTITFSDKTKVKATWTVEALPAMMVGTYWGAATVGGIAGQFQLKLAATGKATGYFYAAGKKISLKSTALVAEGEDCYTVSVAYTYNRVKYADEILLMNVGAVDDVDLWAVSLGGESEVLDDAEATRDVFKETGTKLTAATYVVEDESLEEGDALKAKVTAKGVVKVSGKAADADGNLVSVTGSTQLVFDEEGGLYCWITIYKAVRGKEPIERCFKWYLPEE